MLKDWKSLISKKKDSILCGLFCLLAATGFVLVASTSTSPLYASYYAYGENAGGDSLQRGWMVPFPIVTLVITRVR